MNIFIIFSSVALALNLCSLHCGAYTASSSASLTGYKSYFETIDYIVCHCVFWVAVLSVYISSKPVLQYTITPQHPIHLTTTVVSTITQRLGQPQVAPCTG